ncbi:MAG TPA: Flp pilus assembly protein CpaB [Bryobacteraceae bacterium]|nr:Flp pilus assembly protein CpaB [Bryobacteraceae bacterium]
MLPLLGIAFVVAIISTGVFYGLFAGKLQSSSGDLPGHAIVVATHDLDRGTVLGAGDLRLSVVPGALSGSFSKTEDLVGATLLAPVKANEALLEERVASREPKPGTSGGIVPAGMRAVSLRVSESDGLLSLLRPGSRVDIEGVLERNGIVELHTALQNAEVLSVSPQTQQIGNRGPVSIVTVLTPASEADAVALADSGGRIRLALRNPLDKGTAAHTGSSTSPAAHATSWDHPVQLHVEVLRASDAALGELASQLNDPAADDSLRVAAFHSAGDAEHLVRSLEEKHEIEVVSRERLTAGVGRPISFRAGAKPYQMRLQFSPESAGGNIRLRVKPEISLPSGAGIATRKYDAGLPEGSSFLVRGWLRNPADSKTLDRLFPGNSWEHRQMVVLVTANRVR